MNSEKERLLNRKINDCSSCIHYKARQTIHRGFFHSLQGFCTRINSEYLFTEDEPIIEAVCSNTVTTTANGSCGFWRKK